VKRLLDGRLAVEGELGVDFCGDLARHDVEDLTAELDKETVEGGIDLVLLVLTVLLSVRNGCIDEFGVLGLLCGGEDQRRVGGGILRLVLGNGGKVARVADDSLCN